MTDDETELKPEFLRYVTHKNGQITYSKPGNVFIPKGTEIILRNLPRSTKISDVIHLVLKCGEILQARLLIDFSGQCRTFAYVAFKTKSMAQYAISTLNNASFKDHRLSVSASVDNRRLHISGIPRACAEHELDRIIRDHCSDVDYIIPYMSHLNPNLNRGFMFVEFTSHAAAAQARRLLIANGIRDWSDTVINVDWAEPVADIPDYEAEEINKVFIRNIFGANGLLSNEEMEEFLHDHLHSHLITHIGSVLQDHAVVEFCSPDAASRAVSILDGLELNGHRVFAELARDYTDTTEKKNFAGHQALPLDVSMAKFLPRSRRRCATLNPRRGSLTNELDSFNSNYSEENVDSVRTGSGEMFNSSSIQVNDVNNNQLAPVVQSRVSILFKLYTLLKEHWSPYWALKMALFQLTGKELEYNVKVDNGNFSVTFFVQERNEAGHVSPRVLYNNYIHAQNFLVALDVAAEKAVTILTV